MFLFNFFKVAGEGDADFNIRRFWGESGKSGIKNIVVLS